VLAIDTGRGMAAAAQGGEPKSDVAIMIAGVLGYLSVRHGDAVALVSGSAAGVVHRPPRSTESHLEALLRIVQADTRLEGPASDHAALVAHLARTLKSRSIVIVVGDDAEPDPAMDELLRRLRVQHELLWITVADLDLMAGDGTGRAVVDVDGGPIPSILRGSRRLAKRYAEITERRIRAQHAYFRAAGVSHTRIASSDEVVPALLRLLARRRRAGY